MANLTLINIGSRDVVDASGNIDPLNMVGMIHPFTMASPPTGWLTCEGQQVNSSSYGRLYTAIGTAWGNGGGGSGAFNLPDLRGRFLRGRANGDANDPDRAARSAIVTGSNSGDNVGSYQHDSMAGNQITHMKGARNGGPYVNLQVNQGPVFGGATGYASMTVSHFNGYRHTFNQGAGWGYHQMNMYTQYAGDNSGNRPVNTYVQYCIKY